ncbi:type II secretion system ATPase GspE [Deefgea sp. CFH1-16]|uniref:type II secretion system ATPase GspE n=1 Tax=Deefgea sp. CFH1-16 TaxID=2675457 RepID=UPI0015F4B292|nr:type II secretion system ATPase GspE [Deefgea sp. CFH1-16]MBM5575093.1 type II secretion system protein GspE [Deefgea sp. CFH1-16]
MSVVSYMYAREFGLFDGPIHDGITPIYVRQGASAAALGEVRRQCGPTQLHILPAASFDARLTQHFGNGKTSAINMVDDIEESADLARLIQDMPEVSDLMEAEESSPVIRLINAIFTEALRENASDVHIEPFETRSVVRYRVDGTLRDVVEPNRALHAALVSRIKVMAALDIAEKRLPQDGRINLRIAGRPVDIRVSTLPTGHGERAVLRLLDKSAGRLQLAKLGMREATLKPLNQLLTAPHGIVLVTGPTGSGKTTTLYAALGSMDAKNSNIMTVEDPIEYDLDGIGQTQVNTRIEMSFARALRAILRQDPDIIMIGEIRDLETAQIAVQASLTGHLVLATLHTNDAASAITRLVDMGIEPFLLASSTIGVLAQRLVRNLCSDCKAPYLASYDELIELGVNTQEKITLYRAVGCPHCAQTGYRGRSGIHELLVVDEAMRTQIHNSANEQDIRNYAESLGMTSLRSDASARVLEGVSSFEEMLRITRSSN